MISGLYVDNTDVERSIEDDAESKLHSAEKRRGGRTPGRSPKSGGDKASKQASPESEPTESAKAKDASSPAAATSAASSPPQSDGARSAVVDPDQNQPNSSSDGGGGGANTPDGPCSEDATGPMMALEPLDLGLWEAESEMEMEALLSNNSIGDNSSFTTGLELDAVGEAARVDDLLDMDWDGFAAHLWGDPTQNDQSGLNQASEPQAAGCNPEELESFATWLLSDF
ncbi:hypothetical protein EJB05_06939, partial [Eragrostis curvula]